MGKRRDAARLAAVAGVLLILGGGSGSAFLYLLGLSLAAPLLPAWLAPWAAALAFALALLAALGGLTVLAGAHAIRRGHVLAGKLLVDLGAGMGLVGLLLHLAPVLLREGLAGALATLATLHGAGVALAVAATRRAR